jgi:PAS domain-containing protein
MPDIEACDTIVDTAVVESELRSLDMLARLAADLIERNEAQAALRESREQLRWLASILEFHDDAIVGESLEGIIQSRNKGAERLFDYPAAEVIGKSVTILIPVGRQARSDNSSGSSGAVAL